MAKLTKTTLFKATNTKPETQADKTTRVVRDIVDGAAVARQDKMAALRKARLARDAEASDEAVSNGAAGKEAGAAAGKDASPEGDTTQ